MPSIIITLFAFNPFYFIHYSDPQIGRNAQTVPYCSLAVNQISRMAPAPGFLIVCGDLADDPTNQSTVLGQWRICDSLFDLLPMPKYYTSGNNDLGYANEGCWTPSQLALYRGFWGPDYYALDRDSCRLIALNSTLLDTYTGHACYTYSLEQDSFLRTELASIPANAFRHVFLFFHFPLYLSSPTEGNSGTNVDRPRRDTLLADLVKYNISSVFTGHLHYDLMNFYGPALLESGLPTCETGIGSCGYRVVKVYRNGIETYVVWLSAPSDTVPMNQIVQAAVQSETLQAGTPFSFGCTVDSVNFPDWRGLTYQWVFKDGDTVNTYAGTHTYADTGHFQILFAAYKAPHLAALYRIPVVVTTGQEVTENINDRPNKTDFRVISSVVKNGFIYELPDNGAVSIDLYQSNGRLVLSRNLGSQPPGKHRFEFEQPLSAGIYFARLTSGNSTVMKKLVIIR